MVLRSFFLARDVGNLRPLCRWQVFLSGIATRINSRLWRRYVDNSQCSNPSELSQRLTRNLYKHRDNRVQSNVWAFSARGVRARILREPDNDGPDGHL